MPFKSLVLQEGIILEFIRYYLLSSKDYAEGLASGTTFKELSGARMAEMSIPDKDSMQGTTKQRMLRTIGHLQWLRGRDRVLRAFSHPDRQKPQPFEVDFFGLPYS